MNTPLSPLARARRVPVLVPPRPAPITTTVVYFGADLIDPAYSEQQALDDFYTVQIARQLWTAVNWDTSTSITYYAECISISERLMAERDRLMNLVCSERIGRPKATVASVLGLVTTRMAGFAAGAPEVYEDLDPIQALSMVVGGMLGELEASPEDGELAPTKTLVPDVSAEYGMYSPEGDAALAGRMRALVARMTGRQITREALPGELESLILACAADGFPEVIDTGVREVIADRVNRTCAALGWEPIDSL